MPPRSKSTAANATPVDFGHRKGVAIRFAVFYKIHLTDEGLSGLMWGYGGQKIKAKPCISSIPKELYLIKPQENGYTPSA